MDVKTQTSYPKEPLVDPTMGEEVKKTIYISVPYFPKLSESYKQIFKYTPVQVCFKGNGTLRQQLMHPKDKTDASLKSNIVYQWTCPNRRCKAEYIGETCRTLEERAKEHARITNNPDGEKSAISEHCKQTRHKCELYDFKVIDQESGLLARKAKEAIHIRTKDPSLNRKRNSMYIPHVYDKLLGAKPKHPRVVQLQQNSQSSQLLSRPHSSIPSANSNYTNNWFGID